MPQTAKHISTGIALLISKTKPLCSRNDRTGVCTLASSCISDFFHCTFEIWDICFWYFTFDANNCLRDSSFV